MEEKNSRIAEIKEKYKKWFMFDKDIITITNILDLEILKKSLFEEKIEGAKMRTAGWELIAYPFLPGDKFALVFENKHLSKKNYYSSEYRIMIIDLNSDINNSIVAGVTLVNEAVCTIVGKDEKLFYVLCDYNNEYELLSLVCEDDNPKRIPIGNNVTRAITKENGNIVVGYSCGIEEDIIREYSPDGEIVSSVKNKAALHCTDITTDIHGLVWYHLFPFNKIVCLDNNFTIKTDAAGFDGFFFCKNGDALITSFSKEDEQYLYIMEKQENEFVNPKLIMRESDSLGISTQTDWITTYKDELLFIGYVK